MSTNPFVTNPAGTPAAATPPARVKTVRLFDLFAGLPAVLAATALVGVLVSHGRHGSLEAAYMRDAERRNKANDLHGALIDLKRLTVLDPNREDYRLALALVLERDGNVGRAEALARTMTPLDDREGNKSARLWLVRRLMADSRGSAERLQQAERHLRHLLKYDPAQPMYRLLLGNLFALTNRPREARPLLESVANDSPEILINLANVCKAIGDLDEAKRRSDQAAAIAKKMSSEKPDEVMPRLFWANALLVFEDFPAALEVLAGADRPEVKAKLPTSPAGQPQGDPVRGAMAALCVAWADSLARSGKAKPEQVLDIVEKGLGYEPRNTALLVRLSDLLQVPGIDKGRVRARLEALESDKDLSVLSHFALGNELWAKGQHAEARGHWEKAVKGDPPMTLAANNLAYALAYTEPKDPDRALMLVEKALKANPKEPRLRGTRGQVLTRLGRWKDSVVDLEAAVAGGQGTPAIHGALAEAYEKLGMTEKAVEHRKLAPAAPG